MRISSGSLRGRNIGTRRVFTGKKGEELRPTSAKVREALFDILRREIENASFLDPYAGTGTVGFEAISRGAAGCCFVENSPVRVRTITEFAISLDWGKGRGSQGGSPALSRKSRSLRYDVRYHFRRSPFTRRRSWRQSSLSSTVTTSSVPEGASSQSIRQRPCLLSRPGLSGM